MGSDDDNQGVAISVRIPNRSLYYGLGGLAALFLGIGGAVYKGSENASIAAYATSLDRAEQRISQAVDLAESAQKSAADANLRVSAITVAMEAMRVELLRGQSDRYTKSQADSVHVANAREHELLKRADLGHDRDIERLDKEIDRVKIKVGE